MVDPGEILDGLLFTCVVTEATDLHLAPDRVPRLRLSGQLRAIPREEPLSAEDLEAIVRSITNERQWRALEAEMSLDLAISSRDGTRFRVNVYRQQAGLALAVRRLERSFRTLAQWGLPTELGELAGLRDGLVLVTGPTGSGKSTTLATILHMINANRACHILTIEDPIEYVHRDGKALVNQRELHTSFPSFAKAVRTALREDPDVILVGEMRDVETMRTAITAAETGHLVFSTLHTGDAVGSVERMIGVFPADEQDSIRQQISLVLRQVVTQRLLPRRGAKGMVPAVEVLKVNAAVGNLIRTGRSEQIYSVMETSAGEGMRTLEQELARLVGEGRVTGAAARRAAHRPASLADRLVEVPDGG